MNDLIPTFKKSLLFSLFSLLCGCSAVEPAYLADIGTASVVGGVDMESGISISALVKAEQEGKIQSFKGHDNGWIRIIGFREGDVEELDFFFEGYGEDFPTCPVAAILIPAKTTQYTHPKPVSLHAISETLGYAYTTEDPHRFVSYLPNGSLVGTFWVKDERWFDRGWKRKKQIGYSYNSYKRKAQLYHALPIAVTLSYDVTQKSGSAMRQLIKDFGSSFYSQLDKELAENNWPNVIELLKVIHQANGKNSVEEALRKSITRIYRDHLAWSRGSRFDPATAKKILWKLVGFSRLTRPASLSNLELQNFCNQIWEKCNYSQRVQLLAEIVGYEQQESTFGSEFCKKLLSTLVDVKNSDSSKSEHVDNPNNEIKLLAIAQQLYKDTNYQSDQYQNIQKVLINNLDLKTQLSLFISSKLKGTEDELRGWRLSLNQQFLNELWGPAKLSTRLSMLSSVIENGFLPQSIKDQLSLDLKNELKKKLWEKKSLAIKLEVLKRIKNQHNVFPKSFVQDLDAEYKNLVNQSFPRAKQLQLYGTAAGLLTGNTPKLSNENLNQIKPMLKPLASKFLVEISNRLPRKINTLKITPSPAQRWLGRNFESENDLPKVVVSSSSRAELSIKPIYSKIKSKHNYYKKVQIPNSEGISKWKKRLNALKGGIALARERTLQLELDLDEANSTGDFNGAIGLRTKLANSKKWEQSLRQDLKVAEKKIPPKTVMTNKKFVYSYETGIQSWLGSAKQTVYISYGEAIKKLEFTTPWKSNREYRRVASNSDVGLEGYDQWQGNEKFIRSQIEKDRKDLESKLSSSISNTLSQSVNEYLVNRCQAIILKHLKQEQYADINRSDLTLERSWLEYFFCGKQKPVASQLLPAEKKILESVWGKGSQVFKGFNLPRDFKLPRTSVSGKVFNLNTVGGKLRSKPHIEVKGGLPFPDIRDELITR